MRKLVKYRCEICKEVLINSYYYNEEVLDILHQCNQCDTPLVRWEPSKSDMFFERMKRQPSPDMLLGALHDEVSSDSGEAKRVPEERIKR